MAFQAIQGARADEEFSRLHKLFVEHLAIAVALVWAASLYAAWYAPWLRNIRGLIDPFGRTESTWSFLFGLPCLMSVALLFCALGGETMRRSRVLKSQSLEFALAGLVAFTVFCMAINRVVTAMSLGG